MLGTFKRNEIGKHFWQPEICTEPPTPLYCSNQSLVGVVDPSDGSLVALGSLEEPSRVLLEHVITNYPNRCNLTDFLQLISKCQQIPSVYNEAIKVHIYENIGKVSSDEISQLADIGDGFLSNAVRSAKNEGLKSIYYPLSRCRPLVCPFC